MLRIKRFPFGGIAQNLLTILLIAALNFLLINLAPGDLADAMAGASGAASETYLAAIRQRYGLDQPLYMQFLSYMGDLLRGDLGFSARYNGPVLEVIIDRLPATLLLVVATLGMAFIFGLAAGVFAARRVNSVLDGMISTLALLAYATPLFWLGLMLNVLFALKLGWLPTGGFRTIGLGGNAFVVAVDVLRHMALPVATLTLFYLAVFTRIMRASALEVQEMEYIRTARAKGLSPARILFRHVVRNAMLPMVTSLGLQIGSILGGSIVVETVFGWPGLGRLAYEAVAQRDVRLLLAILLFSSILVIVINVSVDVIYRWLDPRIGRETT